MKRNGNDGADDVILVEHFFSFLARHIRDKNGEDKGQKHMLARDWQGALRKS